VSRQGFEPRTCRIETGRASHASTALGGVIRLDLSLVYREEGVVKSNLEAHQTHDNLVLLVSQRTKQIKFLFLCCLNCFCETAATSLSSNDTQVTSSHCYFYVEIMTQLNSSSALWRSSATLLWRRRHFLLLSKLTRRIWSGQFHISVG
jgi:hypothetical protein